MAAKSMLAAVFLLLAVVAPPKRAAAATHNVGESLGWSIPFDSTTYSDWASTKTFHVGDILVFNFWTGTHDVTEVTKAAFDSCRSVDPISSEKTGPARITLSTAGTHHFICSHYCFFDQKLSVTVRSQPSPLPAAAPTPPETPLSPVASPPAGFSPSPSIKPKTPLTPPPRSAHSPVASPPAAAPLPPNSGNSLPGFSPSPSIKPKTPLSPPPHSAHLLVPSPPAATSPPPPPNSGNSLRGFSLFSSVCLVIFVALLL